MAARLVLRATSSAKIVHGGTHTALFAVTLFGSTGGKGYEWRRFRGETPNNRSQRTAGFAVCTL